MRVAQVRQREGPPATEYQLILTIEEGGRIRGEDCTGGGGGEERG